MSALQEAKRCSQMRGLCKSPRKWGQQVALGLLLLGCTANSFGAPIENRFLWPRNQPFERSVWAVPENWNTRMVPNNTAETQFNVVLPGFSSTVVGFAATITNLQMEPGARLLASTLTVLGNTALSGAVISIGPGPVGSVVNLGTLKEFDGAKLAGASLEFDGAPNGEAILRFNAAHILNNAATIKFSSPGVTRIEDEQRRDALRDLASNEGTLQFQDKSYILSTPLSNRGVLEVRSSNATLDTMLSLGGLKSTTRFSKNRKFEPCGGRKTRQRHAFLARRRTGLA